MCSEFPEETFRFPGEAGGGPPGFFRFPKEAGGPGLLRLQVHTPNHTTPPPPSHHHHTARHWCPCSTGDPELDRLLGLLTESVTQGTAHSGQLRRAVSQYQYFLKTMHSLLSNAPFDLPEEFRITPEAESVCQR